MNKDPRIYVIRQKETQRFVFHDKRYEIRPRLKGAHLFTRKEAIEFINAAIDVELEYKKATNFTKTQLSR